MTTYTNIPQDIKKLKDEKMDKSNNLSDLADRAAAWLNVRPIGSTPLTGDPVSDYDAATKRWVENLINTGTVGPTMNGVMNYGVGDFHLRDSRAYIQPYEVVADGQLLNRADWPELWNYAQMVGAIDDSEWLADKFQRGKYSKGDGATTFRVPDKNGVQEGSVRALYGRGDGGVSSANGQVFESAAPNITGYFTTYSSGSYAQAIGTSHGAFYSDNSIFPDDSGGDAIPGGTKAIAGRYNTCNFNASRSSPIYGASTDEIMGRNFVGVWVIRASGGFIAANTSWSVINSDSTLPPATTFVTGGRVISEYRVGSQLNGSADFRMVGTIGSTYAARVSVYNATLGTTQNFDFGDDGDLNVPGLIRSRGSFMRIVGRGSDIEGFLDFVSPDDTVYARVYSERKGDITLMTTSSGGVDTQRYFQFLKGGNAVCSGGWSTSSDERIKEDITRIPNPLGAMRAIKGVSWRVKHDNSKVNYGFIAQDVEKVFPDAVFNAGSMTLRGNDVISDVKGVDTYGVAAALHHEAILALMEKVEKLETELAALKEANGSQQTNLP